MKRTATSCKADNQTESLAAALRDRLSPASTFHVGEPMARRTTLRVGGPADIFVEPASEADLSGLVRCCAEKNVPFFVIGRGSNLLVCDEGIRGVVICLSNPEFSRIEVAGERLTCGAGARLKAVAYEAKRHGVAGLEFLEGIPGTLGGALRMNAGAMGSAIFDLVERVRLMDRSGVIHDRSGKDFGASYRCCPSLKDAVALAAVLRGRPGDPESIGRRMEEFSGKRWSSQPAAPSAGCIFKNPSTVPAGKLIDELGLKGLRVGGAYVSAEHGNFIVTDANATAGDVLALIRQIQERAARERGIQLDPEVQIIGE